MVDTLRVHLERLRQLGVEALEERARPREPMRRSSAGRACGAGLYCRAVTRERREGRGRNDLVDRDEDGMTQPPEPPYRVTAGARHNPYAVPSARLEEQRSTAGRFQRAVNGLALAAAAVFAVTVLIEALKTSRHSLGVLVGMAIGFVVLCAVLAAPYVLGYLASGSRVVGLHRASALVNALYVLGYGGIAGYFLLAGRATPATLVVTVLIVYPSLANVVQSIGAPRAPLQ